MPVGLGSGPVHVPEDLRYSSEHEWARLEGDTVRVGITDFAQDALGDVVFVQLPPTGGHVDQGGMLGEVESTKSVSEIYAPVAGEVVTVNGALADAPELLNSDPYGAGWICELRADDPGSVDGLLDAPAYSRLTTE